MENTYSFQLANSADFGAQVNSGFEGIASAFLLAGAAEVFATQWDIESLSAVDIVTQYLENFTIKEQNASGLKSALYAYVKKTNQPPYFWAPYLRFKSLNQIKSPLLSWKCSLFRRLSTMITIKIFSIKFLMLMGLFMQLAI